jgi:hypothetical protein
MPSLACAVFHRRDRQSLLSMVGELTDIAVPDIGGGPGR